jgi:hypothetical protein
MQTLELAAPTLGTKNRLLLRTKTGRATAGPAGFSMRCILRFSSVLILVPVSLAVGQDNAPKNSQPRVVISGTEESSATMIAIPPERSWTGKISAANAKNYKGDDLSVWIREQARINGLQGTDLQPWHIVIGYDEFDEDGDNVNSGVFEEFWAGPNQYKRSYTSDKLKQTDYANPQGLFRAGDQRWPSPAELQVRNEVVDPFYYAATLNGFHTRTLERTFGVQTLDCVLLESDTISSSPTQYCFEHGSSALRYTRGSGWFQTAYNDIVSFRGRNVAREVEVTDGGKAHLKLKVQTLETISRLDPRDIQPPADANNLQGKRLSGVSLTTVHMQFPHWPSPLREQHFTVTVALVIGKDGRVLSAKAIDGPSAAFDEAEKAARNWVFRPYLVAGEPEEVETKIMLSNN